MVREWRDLQKLMRGGRGHASGGVSKTGPGELAVQCRACPHPGINIPEGHEQTPPHLRYLYWQTIAVDCNFRLKNRYRPSNALDVRLSPGWAYVVDHVPYLEHVRRFATQEEVGVPPMCSDSVADDYTDEHVCRISGHASGKPQASKRSERDWSSRGGMQSPRNVAAEWDGRSTAR